MPVETEGTAAVAPTSTLDAEFGQLLGEAMPSAEPEPAPETPSDGTTPNAAEPPADTAPDGEAADAVPPSEGTPPDAAATPVEEDDPFASTTAASYVLNGKSIPVEDIRVFAEGGAVIRPESLPNILSKLAERDTLSAKFQTRDAEHQTLSKAVEWVSPEGKTFSGPEAAIEMRIGNAALFAENELMGKLLSVDDLQSYLTTKQVMGADGQPREVVIFRPEAVEDMRREAALQRREITAQIKDHYKTALQSAVTAPPVDFNSVAPTLISQVAAAAGLDASVLTHTDKSILAKHLPFHTRNGLASLEWQDLVKDRIQERVSQKSSQAKVVDTTTKAVKEGQARMFAAARGVKPAQVARPTPKPVVPQNARADAEADAFDAQLLAGASAMRSSR